MSLVAKKSLVSTKYRRGQRKLTESDVEDAVTAYESGESIRSIARRLDTNHSALRKRLLAANDNDGGYGEFDATDVAIILAVADAGIPSGLTELARYMECSLLDVVEVVKECGPMGKRR